MTRLVIAMTLLVCGCFQDHPGGRQELMGTDCYACHTTDYAATTAPIHRDTPQIFSTTCGNCHRTTGWQPALEGLHGATFLITRGPHAPIACLACHDLASALPSKQGANTNCIRCHPDGSSLREDHAGITTVTGTPYRYLADVPNFCLQCHPTGLAGHPDDKFARRDHHAVPCADCHDRAAGADTGGANVTCVESRCHHTVQAVDGIEGHRSSSYTSARGDGTSRNFCHHCHS